jgi:3-deoxy-D-manno-octulosonic-acid transferase
MFTRSALALYSIFMRMAQPLLRRKLAQRALNEPLYAHAVEERFGRYAEPALPADGHTVWVHAVSLGEVRAAAILLTALRPQIPNMRLLLTHGTATGREAGQKLLQAGDVQVWQPWDTPGAVQRFLEHFSPRVGILMETEVWPNLVAACARSDVPLVLANARLSEKSLHQARRISVLAKPAYQALHAVWAQTDDDARRLQSLGANVQGVFGNLKFDATPDAGQLAQGIALRAAIGRPVVLLASSREGEERMLLSALKDNWPASESNKEHSASERIANHRLDTSRVQWLIVPRHPQRFDEVAALVAAQGLSVSRRSDWGQGIATPPAADIWIGDSLGEMALYYGLADVALLGGSFERLGGQNLIEAAACACPIIMGEHTYNFAQAAQQAVEVGAAHSVTDMAQGVQQALALINNPAAQAQAAAQASAFAQAHRGAATKIASAILRLDQFS